MKESDRALAAAISNVAREAQAELRDNIYYMVAQKLTELREIVLNGHNTAQTLQYPGVRLIGLAHAIASLRVKIETELRDNRYYLAAHKLDVLTLISRRAMMVERLNGQTTKPKTADELGDASRRQSLIADANAQTRTANAA